MEQQDSRFLLDLEARVSEIARPKIALPESHDPRIAEVCARLLAVNAATEFYIWNPLTKTPLARQCIKVTDRWPQLEELTQERLQHRAQKKSKTLDAETIKRYKKDPLFQAGALLALGHVDCTIGGSLATTAEVIRAALATVGVAEEGMSLSGAFLMERGDQVLLYSDCGVIADPTPQQLADIARGALDLWNGLRSRGVHLPEPRLAFLSFSTKGSAQHAHVDKMRAACSIAQEKFPSIAIDGELQFDAAIDAQIGNRKAPGSSVAGRANIFIFPDLDAGNIAYKITQRLAGFHAYGPLLCGLAAPYSDLSRGSTVDDIYAVSLIMLLKKAT